jgi:hypothetical protein
MPKKSHVEMNSPVAGVPKSSGLSTQIRNMNHAAGQANMNRIIGRRY